MDFVQTIEATASLVNILYDVKNFSIVLISLAGAPFLPVIKAAPGFIKRLAHLLHRKVGAVVINKLIDYSRGCVAKMAVAFYRISTVCSRSLSRRLAALTVLGIPLSVASHLYRSTRILYLTLVCPTNRE